MERSSAVAGPEQIEEAMEKRGRGEALLEMGKLP